MKSLRIAINGFGRIGRTFFRLAFSRPEIEIIAINDLADLDNLAYLLKYDSVYRQFEKEVSVGKGEKNYLVVGGKKTLFLREKEPAKLPWKELDIDVVIESTGVFESYGKASAHLAAGAKRAVLTAPAKNDGGLTSEVAFGGTKEGKTILLGVNEEEFKTCAISSNGSCTTNAVHPVAQIMSENPGIKKAVLNTIHAYTATQKIVDGPDKKLRRGRAGAINIVLTTSGATKAVIEVMPELKGKIDGLAMRVPVPSGSIVDFVAELEKTPKNKEEINNTFKKEANGKLKEILEYTEDEIVSSDIIGNTHSSIIDGLSTMVIGNTVKVLAWYDNEYAYSRRIVEFVKKLGNFL